MPLDIVMPKLGLTMTEGLIVEWKKREGDTVKKGEILFVLETEKVIYEVEAPEDGVLGKIMMKEQKTVPVGAVVAYLLKPGKELATAEGECAVKNALGHASVMSYRVVPSCIYITPEVASVGLTEEDAKKSHDIQVGRFPFRGNRKALILNETKGMVKVNSDKAYGDILGSHATDMISEAVLGMTMEMTMEELAHAIHPYPTVSAAIMEAALTLAGGIHMPQTPEIGWTA